MVFSEARHRGFSLGTPVSFPPSFVYSFSQATPSVMNGPPAFLASASHQRHSVESSLGLILDFRPQYVVFYEARRRGG